MDTLRSLQSRYYLYTTWRRLRQLWADYRALADGDDLQAAHTKLVEFLATFKTLYGELVEKGYLEPAALDRLFGDVSDILVDLLQRLFDDHAYPGIAAAVGQVLDVAELIVHDAKYRDLVQSTPNLLRQLFTLLDTLQPTEHKRALLRLLATLGESLDTQLEFGRLEGFRKLLVLLVEGDQDLSAEIVHTLQKLIDVVATDPPQALHSQVERLMRLAETKDAKSSKIGAVLQNVGAVLAQLTSKAQSASLASVPSRWNEHIQSTAAIEAEQHLLNERQRFRRAQVGATEQSLRSEVQACMRAQGTLSGLIASLTSPVTPLSMQLEIFESICKLIYASPLAQNEFAELKGYQALEQVIMFMGEASADDHMSSLETILSLLKAVVLDVRGSGLVGNLDAFALLTRLCVSPVASFRIQFHRQLLSLLGDNTLNVAALFEVDAFSVLAEAVILDSENSPRLYQYAAVLGSQMPVKYFLSPLVRLIADTLPGTPQRRCLLETLAELVEDIAVRAPDRQLRFLEITLAPLALLYTTISGPSMGVQDVSFAGAMDHELILFFRIFARTPVNLATIECLLTHLSSKASSRFFEDACACGMYTYAALARSTPEIGLVWLTTALSPSMPPLLATLAADVLATHPIFPRAALHAIAKHVSSTEPMLREAAWNAIGQLCSRSDCSTHEVIQEFGGYVKLGEILLARALLANEFALDPLLVVVCHGLGAPAHRPSFLLSPRVKEALCSIHHPAVLFSDPKVPIKDLEENLRITCDAPISGKSLFQVIAVGKLDVDQVHFRSADSAALLVSVASTLSIPQQLILLSFMCDLCDASDMNCQTLSLANAVQDLSLRIRHTRSAPLRKVLLRLIRTIGLYDISADDANSLIDIASDSRVDESARSNILDAVTAMYLRDVPQSFLSFSGNSGHFRLAYVDNFPASSVGYTFSTWIQLSRGPHSAEPGIIAWTDHQTDLPLYEIFLRQLPSMQHAEERACFVLCIQTYRENSPSEVVVFDTACFYTISSHVPGYDEDTEEDEPTSEGDPLSSATTDDAEILATSPCEWYHLVIFQRGGNVSVYLNGVLIPSPSQVPYPRTLSHDRPLAANVGRRAASPPGFFRGRIAPLFFFKGALSHEDINAAFRNGPSFSHLPPSKTQQFLYLFPDLYASQNVRNHEEMGRGDLTTGRETLSGAIVDTHDPPGVVAHSTRTPPGSLVARVLPLLSDCTFSSALRLLIGAYLRSPSAMNIFNELECESLLKYALTRHTGLLTVAAIDALLCFCVGRSPISKVVAQSTALFLDPLSLLPFLDAIFILCEAKGKASVRVLHHCTLRLRQLLALWISSSITNTDLMFWTTLRMANLFVKNGLPWRNVERCLELLLSQPGGPVACLSLLVAESGTPAAPHMALLRSLIQRLRDQTLVLPSCPEDCDRCMYLALSLVKCESEGVRALSLRLLKLLVKAPTPALFRAIALHLAPFPLSLKIARSLLSLSRATAEEDRDFSQVDTTLSERDKPALCYCEPIISLLRLLRHCSDERLIVAVFLELRRLSLDPTNAALVWEQPEWIECCAELAYQHESADVIQAICSFVEPLLLEAFISGSSGRTSVSKFLDLAPSSFQALAMTALCERLQKYPRLHYETASSFVNNFVLFCRNLAALPDIPARTFLAINHAINCLAVHNSAAVRVLLHNAQLFEVRIELVTHVLFMHGIEPKLTRSFISSFDFQGVAAHDSFRAAGGLFKMLHIMLTNCSEDDGFTTRLVVQIRESINVLETNAMQVRDVLASSRSSESLIFDYLSTLSPRAFIYWCNAPERRELMNDAVSALERALAPFENRFRTLRSRAVHELLHRLRRAREQMMSPDAWNAVAAIEQSRKSAEMAAQEDIAFIASSYFEQSTQQLRCGKEVWERTMA